MAAPRAVLMDIEGTTTAIAFVKDRLFPFAAQALDGFLAGHGNTPAVAAILDEVRAAAPASRRPRCCAAGWPRIPRRRR